MGDVIQWIECLLGMKKFRGLTPNMAYKTGMVALPWDHAPMILEQEGRVIRS